MNYQATPATLLAILAALVLYAMWLARLVKQKKQPSPPYAGPAFLAFSALHLHFWLSPVKEPVLSSVYAAAAVASLAFFFGASVICSGASVICSGAMRMCDGELCIDKNNGLYRIISKLPIKFEGKSLCSISWLAAVMLLVLPVLGAILAVAASLVAVVVCFFTGQNVFKYAAGIMELGSWPYTECAKSKKGWYKGPGIYILPVALAALIMWGLYVAFTNSQFVSGLLTVLMWLAIGVGSIAAVMGICALALKKTTQGATSEYEYGDEVAATKYHASRDDYRDPSTIAWSPVVLVGLFFQVFRQRFCPKIRYVED